MHTADITVSPSVPAGFELMPPFGPFHELIGPIYHRRAEPVSVIGLRVEEKHRNRHHVPMMHGGMIAALIDTAASWAGRHSQEPPISLVTTNLCINLVDNAAPGAWVEAHVDIVKSGRRLVFIDCSLWSEGRRIAQASAQLQVLGPAVSDAAPPIRRP